MTGAAVFSLEVGPYIPVEHADFGMLPKCRDCGGEVFVYPTELDVIDELISQHEGTEGSERRNCLLVPHGMKSYSEYFTLLSGLAEKYREIDPELSELIEWLGGAMKRMNAKEDWSVVRYVGDQYSSDDTAEVSGLTRGRCYYWPCSRENPVYMGVIDNEEFSSYLYPCDPDSWEIVLDPTGMAAHALEGDADTVEHWKSELEEDPESIEAWAKDLGVSAKRIGTCPAFEEELDEGWNSSEADPVNVACPGCGKEFVHYAHTLVNARKNPELRDALIGGKLFEFTCPACGYTASLVSPCLYLDPAHRSSIYLVVSDEMAAGVSGMFDDLSKEDTPVGRSVKRIVFDRHELRGKTICLEAGLGDRAVEILKLAVAGSAKMQGNFDAEATCETELIGMDGEDLLFSIGDDERSFTATMPRGGYELYAQAISRSSLSSEQPYLVDKAWADHAVDVLDREGIL